MKNIILSVLFILSLTGVVLASDLSSLIRTIDQVSSYSEDDDINSVYTVTFGSYPQSSSGDVEPIEWVVLAKKDNKALLLSKYILDNRKYNNSKKDITWENCSLREWLNGDFYNTAFSSSEKRYISTTNLINQGNSQYGTSGGNSTNDKIFILSKNEITKYFGNENSDSELRLASTRGTDYAINNGLEVKGKNPDTWWYGRSHYMLRTPGTLQSEVAGVWNSGGMFDGDFAVNEKHGVRPAMWVDLSIGGNVSAYEENNDYADDNSNIDDDTYEDYVEDEIPEDYSNAGNYGNQNSRNINNTNNTNDINLDDTISITFDGKTTYVTKDQLYANAEKFKNGDYFWVKDTQGQWLYIKIYFETDEVKVATLATGWKEIDGKYYYFTDYGYILTNTTTPDGHKVDRNGVLIEEVQETTKVPEITKPAPKNGWYGDYYYQNDVPVKNTWVDYGSDKYYCGSTGAILKNQWIDNTYYVDNTGKMLKNTTTPDGYKVGADGKYIKETKAPETKVQETKPQETKPQETKPKETKAAEINVQETKAKANTNTTTNLSNKLIPLSEEELNDLAETSLFSLTINNKYVDFIKIDSMNDGFLGLFGNKKYYVRFGYKLKLPEEELVTDYGNKYNNIDGNVIDCLGNKIKKYSYWIPSYTIYTDSKQTAENIKEYIESGNDYTAYFFDAMIESTGKYKADPKSAIFKVPFTSDMVKYARPSKTPNIKLEQDDDGVQLIDGYGMSVKIGKDNSEVRIEFNKNISEDLREKIMNYDLGHQTVGTNIIDNYGHKILKFYYSSFGTYAIYAENYQEAEEIASELNNNDCDYTLYFYDNVKESTGKYKADKSKALFNAALTADMIKNAVYTKTKDMKVVTAENGLQIMEGLNVSVDVGKDVYEIRIELDKTYKGDLKEKIANYYFGHQDIGTNIIDNYGHKILRFYDSSFGTYAIHAETEEEAKEITSVLNSSNCNYVLYFFDNVIESTGKNKVDTGSAKFNVKFTKDMVKYATAKQNVERTVVKDAEGFELMDGLAVSIEEGNDLFEVRIEMNKNMSESNKNKIATYDVAHFEGYGKDVVKTKIYDNYGHRINRFYDSSFGTFMINAENLDQAKEIASELNSSTCDYTLYFFD